MRLQDQVLGWTTPNARDWKDSASPEALMRAMDGEKGSANLPRQAATITGWRSPISGDSKMRISNPEMAQKRMDSGKQISLELEAHMTFGPTTNSSPAVMAKRGALNPALSRWLMGYPVEWCQSAIAAFRKLKQQGKRGLPGSRVLAMPSSLKSRRSSSSPAKKPLENFWE